MKRRGVAGSTLLELILIVLIVALVAWLYRDSLLGFTDITSCEAEGFVCKPRAQGCDENAGEERAYLGRCKEKGTVCCQLPYEPGAGGTGSGTVTSVRAVTLSAADSATNKDLVPGQTLVVLPDQKKELAFSGKVPPCKDCTWDVTWTLETKTGVIASKGKSNNLVRFDGGELSLSASEKEQAFLKKVTFDLGDKYVDEPLTFTLVVTPMRDGRPAGEKRTYTLRFQVRSMVRYAGLSAEWAQQKTITAACEKDVTCAGIYYEIVKNENGKPAQQCSAERATQQFSAAKEITVKYCVLRGSERTGQCADRLTECLNIIDRLSPDQSAAFYALQAGVKEGAIPESVAVAFQKAQGQQSTYTCEADYAGAEQGAFFKAPYDEISGRATFVLDKPFMTNEYLCVYGQDKHDPGKAYVATSPQVIKIDRYPPVAHLEFRPSTLRLRFACEDEESGCKATYGVAYIGDVTRFFPALLSGAGGSAAVWCPAFKTASAYKAESRNEVIYNDDAVRVLCLRVEDQAGNANVAMVTVYNSYDLLAKALAKHLGDD